RNSVHNSSGTNRSTRSVMHGSTSDHAIRNGVLEAAQTAMEQLPRQRRAIAQLYWLAGYSTSEIAALLGVAQSGVRKHIALAGRAIRAAVEPHVHVRMPMECLYPVTEQDSDKPVTAEEGG
ncbi:RNA polymerase sigma factor, partial [Streptomyces sp. NPDC058751]|uniref:RNA polymerase sigma factor n=1 Tax=Streptomyces sp. NPDC058751 TaxID=3346623 RepID=UPI0036B0404E